MLNQACFDVLKGCLLQFSIENKYSIPSILGDISCRERNNQLPPCNKVQCLGLVMWSGYSETVFDGLIFLPLSKFLIYFRLLVLWYVLKLISTLEVPASILLLFFDLGIDSTSFAKRPALKNQSTLSARNYMTTNLVNCVLCHSIRVVPILSNDNSGSGLNRLVLPKKQCMKNPVRLVNLA